MGILGFENYQAPLVRFFLKETLENGQLQNVRSSALDYFLFSVLDKEQRKELIKEAFAMFQKRQGNGRSREKFVWCPKWVQKRFKEELNSKQTGTKRIMQNLSSVNETQPTIEVGPSEQNKPELEKEEGSSEDKFHKKGETVNKEPISSATLDDEPLSKKHSDEDTETSGSEGDGEEDKNTQVAGDNVKVQSDITAKEQGECTNKPTVMAIKDSSVSGCSVKPQLDSDNNSHGNKEVGPTGGPTDPPGKADEFKDDLNLEAKRDPVSACSIKTQQFDSDNVQYCTNQGDCHDTIQDKTSTVSQEKIKGSQAHGNQEVGPNDPPGKAEEFKDDLNEEGCLNAKSDLQGQNTQSGADNSHPVSACSIKTQQFDSDNGQYCTNQGDCHITIQNETLPDLTMVSQEGMLAHGNQEVGPAGGSTETLGKAEFKDDHSACSQHAINVENKDITVREGSEGQCCRNEVIQQITRL